MCNQMRNAESIQYACMKFFSYRVPGTLGVTPSQKTKDLSHRHRPHPRPYSLRLVLIFVRRHVSPQVLGNLRASSQISQSVRHLFHYHEY